MSKQVRGDVDHLALPVHAGPAPGPQTGPVANDAAVRLIIASSVRLVRECLIGCLRGRPDLIVLDAVDLDAEGLRRIAAAAPEVVLVDLAQRDPATAACLVKGACANAKLLAFALAEIDSDVFGCAAAGFSGYVPRECGAEDVYAALIDVVRGRMRCAPHITAAMFDRLANLLRTTGPRASLPMLTAREAEILALAEEGASNKEIGRRLRISSATVKNHMHNILQKLQVTRRGQAVAWLRSGADARGLP